MLGYIDWIIILIALAAAAGALLLLYPQTAQQDKEALRDIRKQAEYNQKRIAEVLEVTQVGAQDAEKLITQLKTHVENANAIYSSGQTRAEQAEKILERASAAELEMRDISSQLGERLQHLQGYWDEQLGDSIESVKRIRSQLKDGLGQVDDSLSRLHEQEKMAQGFTRRLIDYHQEQTRNQQENSRLSAEVHLRLESMLSESTHLLERMKHYQTDADTVFARFNEEMDAMEQQASESFRGVVESSDSARKELTASVEEARTHLGTMRLRETQSDELERRIRQHFEQVDQLRVERLSQSLELTDQISDDLQKGVENARQMLGSLQRAVKSVTYNLSEPLPETTVIQPVAMQVAVTENTNKEVMPTTISGIEPSTKDDANNKLAGIADLKLFRDSDDVTEQQNLLSLRAYR